MNLADIGKLGIKNPFKQRYDNFIGGKFIPPVKGQYFENISPVIGKPIREIMAADIPLAIDHFRYLAGAVRAQEGSVAPIDAETHAYHFHEPLGVVGQIIPWNFRILMAVWKPAPALAAGNCVVMKPLTISTEVRPLLARSVQPLMPACSPSRKRMFRCRFSTKTLIALFICLGLNHPRVRLSRMSLARSSEHVSGVPAIHLASLQTEIIQEVCE